MNPDPKDLLVKLIKCKSVTPNDNGALSVIEDVLIANNFECERLPFGSGAEKVLNLFKSTINDYNFNKLNRFVFRIVQKVNINYI